MNCLLRLDLHFSLEKRVAMKDYWATAWFNDCYEPKTKRIRAENLQEAKEKAKEWADREVDPRCQVSVAEAGNAN